MEKRIGIDIGSDTIKTVVINSPAAGLQGSPSGKFVLRQELPERAGFCHSDPEQSEGEESQSEILRDAQDDCGVFDRKIKGSSIRELKPLKIGGKPLEKLCSILEKIFAEEPTLSEDAVYIGITGSGGRNVSEILNLSYVNEIDAIAETIQRFFPDVRHIIEMGAETQKYLTFYHVPESGKLLLEDAIHGCKCAGGTGSFLEYMHKRLKYDSMEEFAEVAMKVDCPAGISGRCAVFAESDVVHHYQKGTSKERIVTGIHQAVARNFKSLIRKGKNLSGKVALIGGVSLNKSIIKYLEKELELKQGQIFIPEYNLSAGAVGAAFKTEDKDTLENIVRNVKEKLKIPFRYESTLAINLKNSYIMSATPDGVAKTEIKLAALGVDIGSVSTKAALIANIKGEYKVLASHYRRTEGNPIEAVKETLKAINAQVQENDYSIKSITAGTTGSGRYLTGYFIGADCVRDEITAQASGVSTFLKEEDLSIIEIGGQDSKYIRLNNGIISDFEMNWACAAGTGALIEKHAKNLNIDITEFGDYALKGKKPPLINSTCAVFSEAALLYYQQNNVTVEDLCAGACMASAKNYVIKVVRNRQFAEKIAFQGAVAFNRGMVGAFETLLGKKIIVPPYPHLTGAIGIARIAYEGADSPKFKGFRKIIDSQYELSSFECRHCANECSVNLFQVGGEKFFQGDRCDRYSSAHKKSLGEGLPDLFKEREDLLENIYQKETPAGTKTVGIPRGLMFNEYFPFFKAFFGELGFKVVPSEKSNKKIISKGLEVVVAEPCFPIKVAHGHAADLLERQVDFLFLPAIISAKHTAGGYKTCVTCPYVQSAPDVIGAALDIKGKNVKFLKPAIFFDRGYSHLKRILTEVGKELGKKASECKKALDKAIEVQDQFTARLKRRGEEILNNLKEDEAAFVIVGRPYAIHDEALTLNVGKKVRDEGYLAIPLDFFPVEEYDVYSHFPNVYAVEGQKKLAAAKFIKDKKNLHALVVTYFGCGPDAFLDQMFKEMLGSGYLTVQIDEHTSDTGILTRIQAYLSSIKGSKKVIPRDIETGDKTLSQLKGKKKIWVPYMSEAVKIMVALLKAHGIDAGVLPRSGDPSLSLARSYISGDVCIPMLYTTEDMLKRISAPDFNPEKEAFFQGKSTGPCRYGMYFMIQRMVFDAIRPGIDIATIGNNNNDSGLGTSFTMMAWDSMLTCDILEKMLNHTRPYELDKGESDKIFQKYVEEICRLIMKPEHKLDTGWKTMKAFMGLHLKGLVKIIKEAQAEFSKVRKSTEKKPLVGVVGEFFVRLHEPSNQSIVRKLESQGAEVWLAPMTEFFGYSNYITGVHSREKWEDSGDKVHQNDAFKRNILDKFASRDEHKLFEAALPCLEGFGEIKPEEVVEYGSLYVNKLFGGEAILSMGKSEDFARRNLDGIVSCGPFNCMPSLIVSALSREIRRKHGNIPFLNIDYDGYVDSSREQRILMFISQVRERFKAKKK
ncbi:MAG: acyl-CoA dehydratase activase [Firmicutes bacterium]|nr:acyl-CoA dehydratase activase [Bacillota bacterium]